MVEPGKRPEIDKTAARHASTPRVARTAVIGGLLIAVIGFAVIWIWIGS